MFMCVSIYALIDWNTPLGRYCQGYVEYPLYWLLYNWLIWRGFQFGVFWRMPINAKLKIALKICLHKDGLVLTAPDAKINTGKMLFEKNANLSTRQINQLYSKLSNITTCLDFQKRILHKNRTLKYNDSSVSYGQIYAYAGLSKIFQVLKVM